jgi:hypothetical protein
VSVGLARRLLNSLLQALQNIRQSPAGGGEGMNIAVYSMLVSDRCQQRS